MSLEKRIQIIIAMLDLLICRYWRIALALIIFVVLSFIVSAIIFKDDYTHRLK